MLNPTGAGPPMSLLLGGGLAGGHSSLPQAEKLHWDSSTDAPTWGIPVLSDPTPSTKGWRRPERIPRTGSVSRRVQGAATPKEAQHSQVSDTSTTGLHFKGVQTHLECFIRASGSPANEDVRIQICGVTCMLHLATNTTKPHHQMMLTSRRAKCWDSICCCLFWKPQSKFQELSSKIWDWCRPFFLQMRF